MDIKTGWDFAPLLPGGGEADFAAARHGAEKKTAEFSAKWKNREDWLQESAPLAEALAEYEAWRKACGMGGDEGYYSWLKLSLNETDPELKARFGQVEEFANRLGTEMQFFTLRLARAAEPARAKFLAAPELAPWRHFLGQLFREADHVLSEEGEKIMAMKQAPAAGSWERMVSGFVNREERPALLEDGRTEPRNLADLLTLLQNPQKEVRDRAAEGVNDILAKYAEIAENELNALLLNKKVDDELRHFDRPDAARHLNDDIDSATVDALIAAVSARFDIPARFYALKAKLLGLPKLAYHERMVPYGKVVSKFTFESACEMVARVFAGLDPEFLAIFQKFAAGGFFDAYPQKGKHGGAFCAHFTSRQPTYILLNFGGTLDDVQTLAHETGHGINNELVRAAQTHDLNFGTPTSTAEVASTFMEDFVLEEVLKNADEEERLSIMLMKLNDDVSAIFRQAACYRFETDLHAAFRSRGYLSQAEIGGLFQKHMAAYMGPAVEQSAGAENWWVYWSHIRDYFYVYSYAGGQLISRSLQSAVKADPAFIAKVKEFLSAGLSESPRNIFLKMGIDIADRNFWDRGIGETEKLLNSAEELARKLGKI